MLRLACSLRTKSYSLCILNSECLRLKSKYSTDIDKNLFPPYNEIAYGGRRIFMDSVERRKKKIIINMEDFMIKTNVRKAKRVGVAAVACALCVPLCAMPSLTASANTNYYHHYYGKDWSWSTSAKTVDEAVDNAIEIAEQIAAEGQVLLKNNNSALPLQGNEWVTVFSTSGTKDGSNYVSGIEEGGFKVHHTSSTDVNKYTPADKRAHAASDVAIILISGESEATQDAWSSGPGGGGEGTSSASLTEKEDNREGSGATGEEFTLPSGKKFEHYASPTKAEDGQDVAYKHNMQLTNADEDIVLYAKENFDKVIVILQNDVPSEIGYLQYDEEIDAILLSGRIGKYGFDQIGKVLNGSVNPSGRTVDLWAWDITGRPSWYNDGNANNIYNSAKAENESVIGNMAITSAFRVTQDSVYADRSNEYAKAHGGNEAEEYQYYKRATHASGDITPYIYTVEYEEDIYTGYRFYETAATEVEKGNYLSTEYTDGETYYNDAVIYPFGHGISYTEFEWKVVGTDLTAWDAVVDSTETDITTQTGTMKVKVEVTNVGNVAGMDVVEIYGHAPYYLNGVSKAEHELVGFEKTGMIQPGKSQIVTVEVNVQDLAAYDYLDANGNGNTGYELDKVADTDTNGNVLHDSTGGYELRVMKDSHNYGNGNSEGMVIALKAPTTDKNLKVDDFSGNEVDNQFSGKDINNTLSYDPATQKTLVEEGKMTILSRSNFTDTWPAVATAEELVRSDAWYNTVTEFADYNGENWQDYYKAVNGVDTIPAAVTNEDTAGFDWSITATKFAELAKATYNGKTLEWKQAATKADAATQASDDFLWFSDMAKYEYNDGGEGEYMWTKFMNQLTYEEMVEYVTNGGRRTGAIESVGKESTSWVDSTETMNSTNSFGWGYNSLSSRTWNKDLTYKRGVVVAEIGLFDGVEAYYAPAVDSHRSPFAGRNDEYWSEDGFLAGHLAGNMLAGVQSTGMSCTIKHFALNENENMRQSLHTYISEQAFRELYLSAFQIVIQEYAAQGVMTAYNTIGDMHASSAYNFITGMTQNEWGFDGFNITDAADPWKDFYTHDMALRAGTTMFLCDWSASKGYTPGSSSDNAVQLYPTGVYDAKQNKVFVRADGRAEKGTDGKWDPNSYSSDFTVESYTSWYWLRYNVMRSLFVESQSTTARNGMTLSKYVGTTLTAGQQGKDYSAKVGMEGATFAEYSVADNVLPDGLKLASDGTISGKPLESGDYKITVTLTSGNFITKNAEYVLSIASAFEMSASSSGLKVGEAYTGYIDSDIVVTQDDNPDSKYTKLAYSVEGNLPAGLSLDETTGLVSGTPTQSGSYEVTFVIKATSSTSSGGNQGGRPFAASTFSTRGGGKGGKGGSGSSADEYKFTVQFTVADDGSASGEVKYLTEAEVRAIVTEAVAGAGLTESQVNALIDTAIGKVNTGLTEEQVKAIVDKAIENNNAGGGCGASASAAIIIPALLAVAGVAVILRKRESNK